MTVELATGESVLEHLKFANAIANGNRAEHGIPQTIDGARMKFLMPDWPRRSTGTAGRINELLEIGNC